MVNFEKQVFCVLFFVTGMATCTLFASCKGQVKAEDPRFDNVETDSTQNFSFRYDLENPAMTFELPGELREISGLSMSENEAFVWGVQDEKGQVYQIGLKEGNILEKIPFWKDGDYEGIQKVGQDIFVVKSTGTLYRIRNIGKAEQTVDKYNTILGKSNDVEGLGYDALQNRLLLACKGSPGIDQDSVTLEKAIYAFSLDSLKLDPVPAFVIRFEDVHDFVEMSPALKSFEKLTEYFQPGETDFTINPSGISIHPITGEIYLLSTGKKLLVVLSQKGEILYIEKLKKKIHPQPEGICFAKDGTLYISNEGREGKARLHRFSVKK